MRASGASMMAGPLTHPTSSVYRHKSLSTNARGSAPGKSVSALHWWDGSHEASFVGCELSNLLRWHSFGVNLAKMLGSPFTCSWQYAPVMPSKKKVVESFKVDPRIAWSCKHETYATETVCLLKWNIWTRTKSHDELLSYCKLLPERNGIARLVEFACLLVWVKFEAITGSHVYIITFTTVLHSSTRFLFRPMRTRPTLWGASHWTLSQNQTEQDSTVNDNFHTMHPSSFVGNWTSASTIFPNAHQVQHSGWSSATKPWQQKHFCVKAKIHRVRQILAFYLLCFP